MSNDLVCERCGHRNHDQPTFCASCGSFLEWSTSAADALDPAPISSAHAQESSARLQRAGELGQLGGRADLAARLNNASGRIERPAVPVAVVGQFKVGKSRFVNAVVNAAVCPSDPIKGSMVPTVVRHGDRDRVVVSMLDGRSEEIGFGDIEQWVSEEHNAANHKKVAEVSAHLPRQFLSAGIALIDTPGLGGLDSPAGRLLSRTVEDSAAMLLLTAAVQELTQPELAFLQHVRNADVELALAVTKTDLTPHWRRIVEINRGHLAAAQIDIPVFALSAALRELAAERGDGELNDESGYPDLLRWLHDVGSARADHEAKRADRLLKDATAQLRSAARLAEHVMAKPERVEPLLHQLESVSDAADSFAAPDAAWRASLAARADSTADWRRRASDERFRSLADDADTLIAGTAAGDFWGEFEGWLRQRATDTCLGIIDELVERYEQAAAELGSEIDSSLHRDDIAEFPSVGALGAALMVGPLGNGLIIPLDPPAGFPNADDATARTLAGDAARNHLSACEVDLNLLLSGEDDRFRALVSRHVEAQGEELARSAAATKTMARAAVGGSSSGEEGPGGADTGGAPKLTLSSLRAQLDGLDALDAELSGGTD